MTTCSIREHLLPEAAIGTARRLLSVHFGPPDAARKVYIQAGLHADEAPGYLVAARLLELLGRADAAGEIRERIVVVPVANPIGLGQWTTDSVQGRFDNSDHINFNRRYYDMLEELTERLQDRLGQDAGENVALIRKCAGEILVAKEPTTEAETLKHTLLTLSHDADVVLDLHCDHQALLHVYMGTALWPAGADLSVQMGAGATLLANDSGDMPFDEANSKLWWDLAKNFPEAAIPSACLAATVELRGVADTGLEYTEQDAGNLYFFLQRRGFIAGEAPPLPNLTAEATPLEGVDYITATCAGILTYLKQPGDLVQKGEAVALVTQPMNNPGKGEKQPIISRTSGVFFARSADRFARPGKIIGKVAGVEPLEGKGPYLLTF
ncbi:MAG: succinylglutamate desuccinylase/aspartoacylase family protein [Proteobacteria bacterium]|nr:succinylglutamate desuccinylase/aspartoacylase family protein [Pseudomonadota bacterium]